MVVFIYLGIEFIKDKQYIVFIFVGIISLLSVLSKKLSGLRYISLVGMLSMIYVSILMIHQFIINTSYTHEYKLYNPDFLSTCVSFNLIIFAYGIIQNVDSSFEDMGENRSVNKMSKVLIISLLLILST